MVGGISLIWAIPIKYKPSLLLVAAVVVLLAACGGSDATGSQPDTSASNSAATTTDTSSQVASVEVANVPVGENESDSLSDSPKARVSSEQELDADGPTVRSGFTCCSLWPKPVKVDTMSGLVFAAPTVVMLAGVG